MLTSLKNINFNIVLLILPVLLIFCGFCGVTFSWASFNYYDSWRLLEFAIILVSLVYFSLRFTRHYILISQFTIFLLSLALLIITTSIIQAKQPVLALMDILWIISLLSYGYFVTKLYFHIPYQSLTNILAVLSLSPLYVMIWFVIGYYLYFKNGTYLAWHGSFENIRYYDDALLPCLLLLWCQLGFLKKYTKSVVLISSLYLLTLWMDAARANLLGIGIGIVGVALAYNDGYKKLKLPLLSIGLSLIWYQLLLFLEPVSIEQTAIRGGSSNRVVLWLGSFHTWLSHPFVGIGGANFENLNRTINPQHVGHPHNIIIQLVVEWGGVGIGAVLLIFFGIYYLWINRKNIPELLFLGCIALIINMLLSGAHVYPISQIAMILYFSFVVYNIQIASPIHISFLINRSKAINLYKKQIKLYPIYIGLVAVLTLLIIIHTSFFQFNNIADIASIGGPRFWYDARLINLIHK